MSAEPTVVTGAISQVRKYCDMCFDIVRDLCGEVDLANSIVGMSEVKLQGPDPVETTCLRYLHPHEIDHNLITDVSSTANVVPTNKLNHALVIPRSADETCVQ